MAEKYSRLAFDENYYRTGLGDIPYDRDIQGGKWLNFFSTIADQVLLNNDISRVLEVGCAKGFLVECLRDRGAEAYGFDVSEYAISTVRNDIKPFCNIGSADDPSQYNGVYDVIICIEILEHLTEEMGMKAIDLMCKHTKKILFSSSPDDYEEKTHINVQPPEYWDLQFAKHGFMRSLEMWPEQVVASHTVLYVKEEDLKIPAEIQMMEKELTRIEKLYPIKGQEEEFDIIKAQLAYELDRVIHKKSVINTKLKYVGTEIHTLNNLDKKTVSNDVDLEQMQSFIFEKEVVLKETNEFLMNLLQTINKKLVYCHQSFDEKALLWEKGKNNWLINTCVNDPLEKLKHENEMKRFTRKPLISILLPVYIIDHRILRETISSVRNQTYQNWQLCIVYADKKNRDNLSYLKTIAREDHRIDLMCLEKNEGISKNTNHCLKMARGEYIAFLDHDDLITEDALYEVVKAINENEKADILFSDRDLINQNSDVRSSPLFKHAWSWVTMLSANYVIHFTVMNKTLFEKIGEIDAHCDGAQDWDLFLKASEFAREIVHIPKILYHWRVIPSSASSGIQAKPYVLEAQMKALNRYVTKSGFDASIQRNAMGFIQLNWHLKQRKPFEVVIYFDEKYNEDLLKKTLTSLENQYCKPKKVTIIVPAGFDELKLKLDERFTLLKEDSFKKLGELEVFKQPSDGYLMILCAGVKFNSKNTTSQLIAWLEEGGFEGASGKIINQNQLIENAGYVMAPDDQLIEPYKGFDENANTTYGSVNWYREYLAVSEACIMMKPKCFSKKIAEKQRLDRKNILEAQLAICTEDDVRMVYDPFTMIETFIPFITPTTNVKTSRQDSYYNSAIWDWNRDYLKKNHADRKAKLLSGVKVKTGAGIEIGPLTNPVVTKKEGAVYYIDHTSKDELIKKYRHDPNIDITQINDVDFIWGEKTLREAISRDLTFDYVVASHVIEHVPDVIGWLDEMNEILNVGGHICLAIPDKRYTFDYQRQLTTVAELIDSYLNKLRRPSPRQIIDFYANAIKIDTYDAWNGNIVVEKCERFGSEETGLKLAQTSMNEGIYVDVHCSVFTFNSFFKVLETLFLLDLLNFRVAMAYGPEIYSNEFIVVLEKLPQIDNLEKKRRIQLHSLSRFRNL
ncbi:glycosyltransferase [Bacillus sp. es.036]|uniref:glycosyltransferase n=1 Tax=Bacillus sp. es.036 TaxID=1761764 RepID=UPI000BF51F72|nr:methyltransferase domain-containing protein [Bacillus sp. es.036]PFG12750.1 methyltransferase family protein [Bacillus sp. es.036]